MKEEDNINNTQTEIKQNIETEVLDNKCPHCGAKIDFNPKTGTFKCEFCRAEMTLEEMKKHQNASNEKNNKSTKEENVDNYEDYVVYKCKNCGAEIVTDAETTATFCVYCRNTAILKNKLSGKFAPDYIIPFKKEKEDAIEAFKSLAKGRPLVPKYFTDQSNIEKIRGIYIPFWFHDFDIEGDILAKGTKKRYWTVGDTHYTETKVYEIERGGTALFKNVPIDGSERFKDDLMNTIQPYDYKEMTKYNHAYLSGFLAERYDVESDVTKNTLEPQILEETKKKFLDSANGYGVLTIKSNTLKQIKHSVKYVLLPVYMVNVKYDGKMYTFAMNGQTGEFIGNIPVNKKKAILIAILTFVIALIMTIVISMIIFEVSK